MHSNNTETSGTHVYLQAGLAMNASVDQVS